MRGLGSGHVTCGPMRGLKKIAWGGDTQTNRQTNKQTNGHRNSMTESAQWANSVKIKYVFLEWISPDFMLKQKASNFFLNN